MGRRSGTGIRLTAGLYKLLAIPACQRTQHTHTALIALNRTQRSTAQVTHGTRHAGKLGARATSSSVETCKATQVSRRGERLDLRRDPLEALELLLSVGREQGRVDRRHDGWD